jgi:ABC-type transporter Mla subunit MlaD
METSLGQASTALADSAEFLGGSLPQSLGAVHAVLQTVENVAGTVDRTLRVLQRVPFAPTYNPEQPFDQTITNLSKAIEPLPNQVRALSSDLGRLGASADTLTGTMTDLARDIDTLDDQLRDVAALVDRYMATVTRAEHLAQVSRDHLADSGRWAQILLALFGVVFAFSQIVPLWLGSVLISSDPSRRRLLSQDGSGDSP